MMRKRLISAALAVFWTLLAAAGAFAAEGRTSPAELTVSAAMSLKDAFEEIGGIFEKGRPGVKVVFNFSSSGKLRQQLLAGAPVDVFASASEKDMNLLEKAGLIYPTTRADFAGNVIVLIRPKGAEAPVSFNSLKDKRIMRIAMGHPDTSPAGAYSKEVLESLGLWEGLRPKLIFAETVRQALDYLLRGEADAAILYASDIVQAGSVEIAERAPAGSHKPIVYPIAAVKGSFNKILSEEFIKLVTSPKGKDILRSKGFQAEGKGR